MIVDQIVNFSKNGVQTKLTLSHGYGPSHVKQLLQWQEQVKSTSIIQYL